MSSENNVHNIFIGAASAMSAIPVIQPMIFFKNHVQANALQKSQHQRSMRLIWKKVRQTTVSSLKEIKSDPLSLYRGAGIFSLSFVPTVAIQVTTKGFFAKYTDNPILPAAVAGIVSSLFVCPAEGIMVQQQLTKEELWTTAKKVYSSQGTRLVTRALPQTARRECLFAVSYLSITPYLKKELMKKGCSEWSAQITAGLISGTFATVASHPDDTFKTLLQSNFSLKMSTKKFVFQKKKIGSLNIWMFQRQAFKALGWRWAILTSATTIIPFVTEKLNRK